MTRAASVINRDLPEAVNISPNLAGIMTWTIGKLGVGAIFVGMCFYFIDKNDKLHERTELRLIEQTISQEKIIQSYQDSLRMLGVALEATKRSKP